MRALLPALVLGLALPVLAGAQEPEVSIVGRTDCDSTYYQEIMVGVSAVIDSAAALSLITQFHSDPPDAFTVTIAFDPKGTVSHVQVVANNHPRAQRESLAAALLPLVHPQPPSSRPLTIDLDVLDQPTFRLSLHPAEFTCPATMTNQKKVREEYARAIQRLVNRHQLAPAAHGFVVVSYTVRSSGMPEDFKVESSSGSVLVDSAAVGSLRLARFLPAVIGRHAVSIRAQQRLGF